MTFSAVSPMQAPEGPNCPLEHTERPLGRDSTRYLLYVSVRPSPGGHFCARTAHVGVLRVSAPAVDRAHVWLRRILARVFVWRIWLVDPPFHQGAVSVGRKQPRSACSAGLKSQDRPYNYDKVAHNVFWTISAVLLWTAFDNVFAFLWATGRLPYISDAESFGSTAGRLRFVAALMGVPVWRSVHFYFAHRLLHFKPLYQQVRCAGDPRHLLPSSSNATARRFTRCTTATRTLSLSLVRRAYAPSSAPHACSGYFC